MASAQWAVIQIQADYPLGDASLVSCVHEETRAAGLWAKFERTAVRVAFNASVRL